MGKIFRWDSPVMEKIALVGNLVLLNMVWLLCCIPLITAGAATTAMYYTVFQFQAEGETEVLRPFFRSFCKNFKQATLLWIPALAIIALMLFNAWYLISNPGSVVIWAAVIILSCILLMLLSHIFPMLARFEQNSKTILHNSLLLTLLHLPTTVLWTALNVLPFVVFVMVSPYTFAQWLPLWVGLWFSMTAYLNGKMQLKIWAKHIPKEETPEETEEEIAEEV